MLLLEHNIIEKKEHSPLVEKIILLTFICLYIFSAKKKHIAVYKSQLKIKTATCITRDIISVKLMKVKRVKILKFKRYLTR